MNGGLVRQVALEWRGKGQGTQWPNMEVEVQVLDQGGRRVLVKAPQFTVHILQCTCTRTCICSCRQLQLQLGSDPHCSTLLHFFSPRPLRECGCKLLQLRDRVYSTQVLSWGADSVQTPTSTTWTLGFPAFCVVAVVMSDKSNCWPAAVKVQYSAVSTYPYRPGGT